MLDRYKSTGPRGMMLVPRAKEAVLEGVELPEAPLYDFLYALQQALERHDRDEARKAYDVLNEKAPGHRLTLHARRTLASYDADRVTQLQCVEDLLKLYPDDANLLLEKLGHLRELGRRDERLELLARLCAKDDSPPLFWQQYARELAADDRRHSAAMMLLRRAIRFMGRDAESYHSLAAIFWNRRRLEEALELYRFAACIEDRNENYAQSYFFAARHLRQTAAALLFLRNRFRRFGRRSGWPARTLFWAYTQLDRSREALEVLEEALALRPEDGDLLLFASDVYDRIGSAERAAAVLQAAEGKSRRTSWLRAAAHQAATRGEGKRALELWREVVAGEPLATDAHAALMQLCAETESRAAALDHLRAAVERFPHHAGLHQLWIEWLRDGDPEAYEAAILKLIAINSDDPWTRRILAIRLASTARLPQALEQADLACRLDPSASSHYVRARVLWACGRTAEAKEACRDAIRLSVDMEAAIFDLVSGCESLQERRDALEFVRRELGRQVVFGDGLLTFREVARDTIEPEELRVLLQEALEARPDLWHAWSAAVRHLSEMNRIDEALEKATQATERFPLVAPLWVDLASVHQLRGDGAGERAALEQAVKINPSWGKAARELAAASERAGDFASARTTMEQAIQRAPLDAYNHGGLAQMLWKMGEKEAALERLAQAVRLEPSYDWAWGRLSEWAGELGRPDAAERPARELTERRPGEARSWMVLARTLEGPARLDERLQALATAIRINSRLSDARDLQASLLAGAGRFVEALEACGGDDAPLSLRGRAAWIEAERGNRRAAIAKMTHLTASDPTYAWGWLQLADWHEEEGNKPEYLEAARHLVRLAPQDEAALGTLADAKLKNGDRAGAKADYRRAIDLAPDYGVGVFRLFDLHLEDGEVAAAAQVLAPARKHLGGPFMVVRELQLAAKQRRMDDARALLRTLCGMATAERWPYVAALAALSEAGEPATGSGVDAGGRVVGTGQPARRLGLGESRRGGRGAGRVAIRAGRTPVAAGGLGGGRLGVRGGAGGGPPGVPPEGVRGGGGGAAPGGRGDVGSRGNRLGRAEGPDGSPGVDVRLADPAGGASLDVERPGAEPKGVPEGRRSPRGGEGGARDGARSQLRAPPPLGGVRGCRRGPPGGRPDGRGGDRPGIAERHLPVPAGDGGGAGGRVVGGPPVGQDGDGGGRPGSAPALPRTGRPSGSSPGTVAPPGLALIERIFGNLEPTGLYFLHTFQTILGGMR